MDFKNPTILNFSFKNNKILFTCISYLSNQKHFKPMFFCYKLKILVLIDRIGSRKLSKSFLFPSDLLLSLSKAGFYLLSRKVINSFLKLQITR